MSFFGLSPSLALDARGCFDEDALEDALEALGLFFVEDFDAGIGEKEGRSGDCKPLNPNPCACCNLIFASWLQRGPGINKI